VSTMTELLCPKCHAPMRVMERNGVTLERCTECGGIFLDRGELERLMRAEGEFNTRTYSAYRRDDDDDDDDDDDHKRGYSDDASHQGRPYRKKKKRNFLEDIFDFG
jgi:Zn-finger nucleic acid-binding protein